MDLIATVIKMNTTIAIAGKGGTGKSTIAALLIKLLSQKGVVLAVDGDPSADLNQALGLPLKDTVGGAREEMTELIKRGRFGPGVSKQEFLDYKVYAALVESDKIDLLAMGRPEGPGCYCAANHMLRASLDHLSRNYDYVVIDCEAGMEHISRRTTRDVDILLVTSDPTMRGITTAARMKELIGKLRVKAGKISLVVNRVANGRIPEELKKIIDELGLELMATIPEDPGLAGLEIKGLPVIQLPPDSPLQVGVREIANKLGLLR